MRNPAPEDQGSNESVQALSLSDREAHARIALVANVAALHLGSVCWGPVQLAPKQAVMRLGAFNTDVHSDKGLGRGSEQVDRAIALVRSGYSVCSRTVTSTIWLRTRSRTMTRLSSRATVVMQLNNLDPSPVNKA